MAIGAGDFLVFCGNSITFGVGWNEDNYPWFDPPGGLIDQINDTWPAPGPDRQAPGTFTGRVARATGRAGVVQPVAAPAESVTAVSSGDPGANSSDIAAAAMPAALALMPGGTVSSPVVIIECGINDAYEIHLGIRTLAEFIAGYEAIFDQLLAEYPAARVICVGCFCIDEAWKPGPTWVGTFINPIIVNIDNAIQALCTTYGATFVDVRTPLLAWEVINNPLREASEHAAIPNGAESRAVHPKIAGMMVMAEAFLDVVPITP